MLDEEDNIKEDGEDAKSELGWVSKDQRPFVCEKPEGAESGFRLEASKTGRCVCVCGGGDVRTPICPGNCTARDSKEGPSSRAFPHWWEQLWQTHRYCKTGGTSGGG